MSNRSWVVSCDEYGPVLAAELVDGGVVRIVEAIDLLHAARYAKRRRKGPIFSRVRRFLGLPPTERERAQFREELKRLPDSLCAIITGHAP